MPINVETILAAGKAVPQLSAPDPLERYGRALTLRNLMQQGDLGALQYETAQRDMSRNARLEALFGSNPNATSADVMAIDPIRGMAFRKSESEQKARDATTAHTTAQTQDLQAGHLAGAWAALAKNGGSDEGVRIAHDMMLPYVGPEQATAVTNSLLALPPDQRLASSISHAAGHKVGQEALKLLFPAAHMQDFGGAVAPVSTSTMPGGPAPGSVIPGAQPIAKTQTPDSVESNKRIVSEGALNRGVTVRGQNMVDARLRDVGAADTSNPEVEKSVQYWSDVLRKGGSLPPGLARNRDGAALVKEVMKRVAQGDTSPSELMAGQAEFMGEKAGQRTLGTRTANIEMAVTEARNVIPLALAASEKVNRTNYPTLNSILLAAEKGTGDSNVVQLGVATNSLINVYARAIAPSGVPTVSDKDHAREILSTAYAKGQYRAAVDMMEQEMKAAQQSPGQVKKSMREQFTGGAPQPAAPQRRATDSAQPTILDALPDPRQHSGKLMITDDGGRYRSDGAKWKRER